MLHHREAMREISGELVTHLLGFEPGDENYERSMQYACSNLFYHRCLSPEPRQLQEQVEGVLLKLAVHGRGSNRDKLKQLVEAWTTGPEAELQKEVRWSILSLLLELSYNPTDFRLPTTATPSASSTPQLTETRATSPSVLEEDLVELLLSDRLPAGDFSPDEPLSDWSDISDDEVSKRSSNKITANSALDNKEQPVSAALQDSAQPSNVPQPASVARVETPFSSIVTQCALKAPISSQKTQVSTASFATPSTDSLLPTTSEPQRGSCPTSNVKTLKLTSSEQNAGNGMSNPAVATTSSYSALTGGNLVPNGCSVDTRAADSIQSRDYTSCGAPINSTLSLSPNELLKEASRARQWLDANTQQKLVDCYGVELVTEKELVTRVLQGFFCPDLFKTLLQAPPATPTLNQASVESVLQRSFLPAILQLREIEKTFSIHPSSAQQKDRCSGGSKLGTQEPLYAKPARNSSNNSKEHALQTTPDSDHFTAFCSAVQWWKGRLFSRLQQLVDTVKSGDQPVTLVWLVSSFGDIRESISVVHSVLLSFSSQNGAQDQQNWSDSCQDLSNEQQQEEQFKDDDQLQQQQKEQHQHPESHRDEDKKEASAHSGRLQDLRLLGSLLQNLETSATPTARSLLLQMLLLTLQPLLHKCLLQHPAQMTVPSVVYRDEDIDVRSESYWNRAFAEPDSVQEQILQIRGLEHFLPILELLRETARSLELLCALEPGCEVGSVAERRPGTVAGTKCLGVREMDALEALVQHAEQLTSQTCNPGVHLDDVICHAVERALIQPPYDPFLSGYGRRYSGSSHTSWDTRDVARLQENNSFGDTRKICSDDAKDCLSDPLRRLETLRAESPVSSRALLSLLLDMATEQHCTASSLLNCALTTRYCIGQHISALCTVMILQPSNVLKTFTAALLLKDFAGESLNTSYLTMELHECLEKLYPKVAHAFSVVVHSDGNTNAASHVARATDCRLDAEKISRIAALKDVFSDAELAQLDSPALAAVEAQGLSQVYIAYEPGWPLNALLPSKVVQQYNSVLQFCLKLQRMLHTLHALNFRDMRSWDVVESSSPTEPSGGPETTSLGWRLQRLQLLRHWLLHFCRTLHDHFATVVLLPFQQALHGLVDSAPPVDVFLKEHAGLVRQLQQQCLLSSDGSDSPAQTALNQVAIVVDGVRAVWRNGGCGLAELNALERRYATAHAFLLRLLSALVKSSDKYQHVSALVNVLADSCPVSV